MIATIFGSRLPCYHCSGYLLPHPCLLFSAVENTYHSILPSQTTAIACNFAIHTASYNIILQLCTHLFRLLSKMVVYGDM